MATPLNPSVRPGPVEWTGDNPFIYLKTDAAGDWSSLSLYFRIALSPFGPGQAMLVLEAPYDAQAPAAARVMLTDNQRMGRYLLDEFVRHFMLFRPSANLLKRLEIVDDAVFESQADARQHTQVARSPGKDVALEMRWTDLREPFMATVPAQMTQTGRHEMYTVFQPAGAATVRVDGRALPGTTVERDFFGGRAQSASLAHAETWVRAADGEATR